MATMGVDLEIQVASLKQEITDLRTSIENKNLDTKEDLSFLKAPARRMRRKSKSSIFKDIGNTSLLTDSFQEKKPRNLLLQVPDQVVEEENSGEKLEISAIFNKLDNL